MVDFIFLTILKLCLTILAARVGHALCAVKTLVVDREFGFSVKCNITLLLNLNVQLKLQAQLKCQICAAHLYCLSKVLLLLKVNLESRLAGAVPGYLILNKYWCCQNVKNRLPATSQKPCSGWQPVLQAGRSQRGPKKWDYI